MHKQFFRLLISIVGITLIILIMQCATVVCFNLVLSRRWKNQVMSEFAFEVEQAINNKTADSGADNTDGIINISLSHATERISGIIYRDSEGDFALSFGKNPKGVTVPNALSFRPEPKYDRVVKAQALEPFSNNERNDQLFTRKISKPKYEIAIYASYDEEGKANELTEVEFKHLNTKGKTSVEYPKSVEAKDIAGTILITVNGIPAGYLDILAFGVNFYTPTKYIINELFRCFLLTLPVAMIISFLLAYYISKRNEKLVREYKKAIEKLSIGEFNIEIPLTHIEEFDAISKSLKKLGRDLEMHSNCRKEWIRNISHDLNTPLASMNILLSGAEDKLFPLDDTLISNLKKENDTLISRIASVAYYSYLLSPDCRIKKDEFSIFECVDEVLQKDGKKARVELDMDTKLYGDFNTIERALEEVIKNASSYKTDGDVLIRAEKSDKTTAIKVINNGHLPTPRPIFFEPWARGDESRSEGGSGMGLSITYQIMLLNGGSVEIEEQNDKVIVSLIFPNQ